MESKDWRICGGFRLRKKDSCFSVILQLDSLLANGMSRLGGKRKVKAKLT